MIVSLTGFMASGKTTFGKAAARQLNLPFIDLDREIERRFGPISEIFTVYGEDGFRKKESDVLKEILNAPRDNSVISLGGGTILFKDNLRLIKNSSKLLWLDTSWPLIMSGTDFCDRPLANKLSENELRILYNERKKLYRLAADMVVIIDKPDYQSATEDVTQAVRKALSL